MGETLAIIPARGGSKRVPRKNLYVLEGRPLIVHSIEHALAAEEVDSVCVSTEDPEIAEVAAEAGASVVRRPGELAGDAATSESALLHALDAREGGDPALVVFLQATSPVRTGADIDAAIRLLRDQGADSLFSACRDRGLFWLDTPAGPQPQNYRPETRRREQDMDPQYRENGSIYLFRPSLLRERGVRLGGRVALYEMDSWASIQIDTPDDVDLAGWVLSRHRRSVPWPDPLELVVFDFDGVMTDNTALVDEDGTESVRVDRGDGWGIARLRERGIPLAVLSTEGNPVVAARCRKLGIHCVQDVPDKAAGLRELLEVFGARAEHAAYVGNDVNDLPALRAVGLPVVVGDAHPDARAAARLVLSRRGGAGAVREFCDLLLAHQGASAS
jgi:N-acylneuraminate cytidylyltransferase